MSLRMERIVPLIGPTVVGPLGVAHLPRMWLKAVLNAADTLPESYFPHYFGFNKKVVDGLGLDPEAFFTYLGTMPTYAETERWVRANAKHLDPPAIAALNIEIATFPRPEERAAPLRERIGLTEPIRVSAQLINLEDWFDAHAWLVAHRDDDLEAIIPTISASTAGPFGVSHLPRLWMKALLTGVNALPEGWNSGFGFDQRVADTIGLDLAAACAYIHAELPNYLQFEQWVQEHIAPHEEMVDRPKWNLEIRFREKADDKAAEERAEAGVPELSHKRNTMLNDMVDWTYLHAQAVDRRAARA
jgi:hypothetical protein